MARCPTPLRGLTLALLLAGVVHAPATGEPSLALQLPDSAAPTEAPAPATNPLPTSRPRIGLVLGGGGARGGAHIGVLKVLEELRIPVDYIAGTSVGAIVGGLYAAGYSPDELEAIVRSTDWQELFRDRPPREDLTFRRKQDDRDFPSRLELGFRSGRLLFPPGFVSAQKLTLALRSLTLPWAEVDDFDRLPIPFRAVATDLVTGRTVVLGRGDLATSIRASMAVPGAFSPVELGPWLLVDGGVTMNVPVGVAREMGADVVIAVDVATPLGTRDDLRSAVSISAQVLRIAVMSQEEGALRASLGPDDVVLRPDLEGIGASSFRQAGEAVPAGIAAARGEASALRRLSIGPEEFAGFLDRQRRGESQREAVAFVRFEGPSRYDEELIRSRVRLTDADHADPAAAEQDVSRIYGLGLFEKVDYRPIREGDAYGIVIETRDKSWGPDFVRFALNLGDDLAGSSDYTLLTSYTLTGLNRRGAELRNELRWGATRGVSSELYQPLAPGSPWFAAPRVRYRRDVRDVFPPGSGAARYRVTEYGAGIDGGLQFGHWGELRLGVARGRAQADPRAGPSELEEIDVAVGTLSARLAVDVLDDRSFPTRGGILEIELVRAAEALGSDLHYDRLHGIATGVVSRAPYTLLGSLELGSSLGSTLPLYDDFPIGGFLRISGLQRGEDRGDYMALGRLVLRRSVATLPSALLGGDLHLGASVEAGEAWPTRSAVGIDGMRAAGSLFLGLETLMGPLYVAYGRADRGQEAWYLSLGRAF